MIGERAYPDLSDEAKETLPLNAYLAQLDDPQVAFGVKQKTTTDLDSAVTATMELESYLVPVIASTTAVVTASSTSAKEKSPTEVTEAVAAAVTSTTERLASLVEKLTDCVEQLEATRARPPAAGSRSRQANNAFQGRSRRYIIVSVAE